MHNWLGAPMGLPSLDKLPPFDGAILRVFVTYELDLDHQTLT